jgi:hypothetical protein
VPPRSIQRVDASPITGKVDDLIRKYNSQASVKALVFRLALQRPQAVVEVVAVDDAGQLKRRIHICARAAVCLKYLFPAALAWAAGADFIQSDHDWKCKFGHFVVSLLLRYIA